MTKGKNFSKTQKGRIHLNFHSLKFRLFCFFMLFTAAILALVWFLQVFFLNNYYEEMKSAETNRIANTIKTDFARSNYDTDVLYESIHTESASNDLTILVVDKRGNYMTNEDEHGFMELTPFQRYSMDIAALDSRLSQSSFDSATILRTDSGKNNKRTLEFACYLGAESEYTMYIFSPLYPVASTVDILRNQLFYISIIAILLALGLALYLSTIITRPIRKITTAAAEMGKGNYDVTFQGGHYTEIIDLADTLTHAESELQKTDMYHKDLIANVSHDLKTPLTMIKSYAEMIRDLSGDNPVKRNAHLQVIIEETDRLNTLVNAMLNLSRMQSGKINLELSTFDMQETAEQALQSYYVLTESDGYQIDFQCDKGPFPVYADRAKILQVMNNLLSNAMKYCGEDKYILVELRRIGKDVRFSVTDHGQGISPDEITHVWERYYKSSTHHVRSADGTGLGLSIVKEILKLHDARFDVESVVGEGSTFWFELPLERSR